LVCAIGPHPQRNPTRSPPVHGPLTGAHQRPAARAAACTCASPQRSWDPLAALTPHVGSLRGCGHTCRVGHPKGVTALPPTGTCSRGPAGGGGSEGGPREPAPECTQGLLRHVRQSKRRGAPLTAVLAAVTVARRRPGTRWWATHIDGPSVHTREGGGASSPGNDHCAPRRHRSGLDGLWGNDAVDGGAWASSCFGFFPPLRRCGAPTTHAARHRPRGHGGWLGRPPADARGGHGGGRTGPWWAAERDRGGRRGRVCGR